MLTRIVLWRLTWTSRYSTSDCDIEGPVRQRALGIAGRGEKLPAKSRPFGRQQRSQTTVEPVTPDNALAADLSMTSDCAQVAEARGRHHGISGLVASR